MKNFNRIISWLLAVLMIMSALSVLATLNVFADETKPEEEETVEDPKPLGNSMVSTDPETDPYINTIYANPDEKIATMRLAIEKDGYALYVDDYSGEVACVNTVTGEKLFTNPYDVGSSSGAADTKYNILSQIIVTFTDNSQGGAKSTFNSYTEAAQRGQIIVENIKSGVRVEYTIGREQSKTLVPRLMSLERFQEMILSKLEEAFPDGKLYEKADSKELLDVQAFLTRYTVYSLGELSELSSAQKNSFGYVRENLEASDRDKARVMKDYPVVAKMAVCVFDTTASEAEIVSCEDIITKYCPEYTYEELEWDHAITDYESDESNPPVFRLALEYKIEDDGLSVRLPANGIRFNEALYTLETIDVLPYMGAGHSAYEGFNFFPDGSGTIFEFQDIDRSAAHNVAATVYGTDYAYHKISGTYQQTIRYPVFGIVEHTTYNEYVAVDLENNTETVMATLSGAIVDTVKAQEKGEKSGVCVGKEAAIYTEYRQTISNTEYVERTVKDSRGFVAIIEEGDALTSLTTSHPQAEINDYHTIMMSISPRPKDTYNLQESISVGSGGDFDIVCDRKYVGSYKIKYTLLSDTTEENLKLPEGKKASDYKIYDTSWMGMAVAYRTYLYDEKVLEKNTNIIDNNIPLYIETFGAVETTKKILSVPVQVMESLTTFEEVKEIYGYLSEEHNINNINFKLTGYANGGMYYTVPGKLDFEEVVGGNNWFQNIISKVTKEKDGFQQLLDAAADVSADENKNFGIFPDFDLAYQLGDASFDGYRQRDHAAKTIDDRYASRREYSATQQKYMNYFEIVISPAYFDVLYNRIEKNYAKKYENIVGISVGTLGEALNSDFDEDEPYNREDSKQFTIQAFQSLDSTYDQVMTSGGNAYVWKYTDHILNVSLDSSRYIFSSNAVPFVGVVLHGSISFAGQPLNMEGDMQYAILKAIENGAAPYFILSMDNTEILKEYFDLSQYYSIRYDIWKDDIANAYHTLNGVLGDVQDKYIIDHEFLEGGVRVPDSDELENDIYESLIKDLEDEDNALEILLWETKLEASIARKNSKLAEAYAAEAVAVVLQSYINQMNKAANATKFDETYFDNVKEAYINYYLAEQSGDKDAIASAKNIREVVSTTNKPTSYFAKTDADIDATIAQYKAELDAAIAAYAEAHPDKKVNKENYGDTELYKAYNSYATNRKNYYKALDDLEKAEADLAAAEKDLANAKTNSEKTKAQKAIDKAKSSIDKQTKNIEKYQTEAPDLYAKTQDAELLKLAQLYYRYDSAVDAKKAVVDAKYEMDFATYAEANYHADMYKRFYSGYKNAAISEKNVDDTHIIEWYNLYVESNKKIEILDDQVAEYKNGMKKGQVDNYIEALAKVAALEHLGYKDSEDAEKQSTYETAVSLAKSVRSSAVDSIVALKTTTDYRNINNYYENIDVHMAVAVAAIDVLVKAENDKGINVEIKYAEGSEKTIRDIVNYDEIALKSSIVKQAIDRAIYVLDCFERDTYQIIVDGRDSDVVINGHNVRTNKDEKGVTYYFYGNNEQGYSYFTISEDGTVAPYILPGATKSSATVDGLNLYEIKLNNQKVFFTASAEGGYTYYIKDEDFNTYVLRDPITYSGDKVSELNDGTEIFFDAAANVYFSQNADGTYTRYSYFKSIADAYKSANDTIDATMKSAFALAAKCVALDPNFEAEIIRRIEFANTVKPDDDGNDKVSSRYDTDNIVAVTYGAEMGDPYKTVILNYNNYTVNIKYNGKEYTIPAYEFVEINYENK